MITCVLLLENEDGTVAMWFWNGKQWWLYDDVAYANPDKAFQSTTDSLRLLCGWGANVDGFYELK